MHKIISNVSFFFKRNNLKMIINGFSIIFLICIFDLLNFDNSIYEFISKSLGIKNIDTFDLDLFNFLQILGVLIAAFVPFHILSKEQETNKIRMVLEYKPFLEPSQIRFRPFGSEIKLTLTNIGNGPAIFVRLSFFKDHKDFSHQSLLRINEPHSRDLGPKTEPSTFFFDQNLFANFITKNKNAGLLATNLDNHNIAESRDKLNNLFRSKIGDTYYMYIHCLDTLDNKYIFEIKFLLELEDDYDPNEPQFLLKRMEVKQLKEDLGMDGIHDSHL